MKDAKKTLRPMILAFLLLAAVFQTFSVGNAAGDNQVSNADCGISEDGKWWRIQTEQITILFPAGGRKPMFLWWYTNDTSNVFVVKYKGLVEYLTLDYPYYIRKYQADSVALQERLEAKYASSGPHQVPIRNRIRMFMSLLLGVHPSYLPFSACQWNLTGPVSVTREDGISYISFNFTLTRAPMIFQFAENNVVIRARFYTTDATENAYGLHNYTVHAGELKMDLVVRNWEWNIDRLADLFDELHQDFGITVPQVRGGLALWADLASIQIENMPIAEQDANSTTDSLEANSIASDMIVGGQRIQVQENRTAMGDDETPIRNRIRERYRLQFAKGNQILAGFFDFVDKAALINETTGDIRLANVTAAYISAGAHMRLFIGYPYFGGYTLEHDPSIGVESVATWLPTGSLMILIGTTILVAAAIMAIRLRKKTVNIVSVQ